MEECATGRQALRRTRSLCVALTPPPRETHAATIGGPALDFTGIHLAGLCGGNGHGKSALLDAITWCLWGKARGKTQDELISFGADECRVQLEFTSRNESYRVIRSHSRGGGRRRQGASDLQLQLLDGEHTQPITGNTIRETQAKIEQTVGMDAGKNVFPFYPNGERLV